MSGYIREGRRQSSSNKDLASSNNPSSNIDKKSDILLKGDSDKEIIVKEKDIYKIQDLIIDIKDLQTRVDSKVSVLDEIFNKNILNKVNDTQYIYDERKLKLNLKSTKSTKSDSVNSDSKKQPSILNLGFVTKIKVGDKKKETQDVTKFSSSSNKNNNLENINLSKNNSSINNQQKERVFKSKGEQKHKESKEKQEKQEQIQNEKFINKKNKIKPIVELEEENDQTHHSILLDKKEEMIIQLNDEEESKLPHSNHQSTHQLNSDIKSASSEFYCNRRKGSSSSSNTNPNVILNCENIPGDHNPNKNLTRNIPLNIEDDKQANYKENFFDYKSLHQTKEREKENLKRVSDEKNNNGNSNKRPKKNEWISKEIDPEKKGEQSIPLISEPKKNLNFTDINTIHHENYKAIEKEDKIFNPFLGAQTTRHVEIISSDSESEEKPKPKILTENILNSLPQSNKNIGSPLSLVFDSNLPSKDKNSVNISNFFKKSNFEDINQKINEVSNQGSKYSDFLKLKKEKNLSKNNNIFNQNKSEVENLDKKQNYELDLQTLDESYNDFYELKPQVKKNPFIPNELKNRAYKNTNNSNRNKEILNNLNAFGIVRNKKEREKMNGYKCEICANFYEILGESSNQMCQECSRHRKEDDPNMTPKGYYDMSI